MADYQNYGFANNIAQGIREGMIDYTTFKNQQRQNDMLDFSMKSNGIIRGQDGTLQYTPEAQARRQQQMNLQDQQTKEAQAAYDPTSQTSQSGMGLLKSFGYQGADISAHDQQGLLAGYEKKAQMQSNEELKKAQIAATKEMSQSRMGQTQDNQDNSKWAAFAKEINDPSSRAQIGRYQQNLDKANTINVLANQIGMAPGQTAPKGETNEERIARFNKADPRQLYEFAKAADQLTSATNSTVYGTDHLMPNDMQIGQSKFAEWLSGKPVQANSGEFVQRYLDSANREKAYYQQQRDKSVSGVSAGYKQLQKKDPDRWEEVLGNTTYGNQQAGTPQLPQSPQGNGPGGLMGFEEFMRSRQKRAGN
jgi:hypothetical protein